MFGKYQEKKNIFENEKQNPFTLECPHCISNIWEKIKKSTEELENKCYKNTYVWIEKFKEDNYYTAK